MSALNRIRSLPIHVGLLLIFGTILFTSTSVSGKSICSHVFVPPLVNYTAKLEETCGKPLARVSDDSAFISSLRARVIVFDFDFGFSRSEAPGAKIISDAKWIWSERKIFVHLFMMRHLMPSWLQSAMLGDVEYVTVDDYQDWTCGKVEMPAVSKFAAQKILKWRCTDLSHRNAAVCRVSESTGEVACFKYCEDQYTGSGMTLCAGPGATDEEWFARSMLLYVLFVGLLVLLIAFGTTERYRHPGFELYSLDFGTRELRFCIESSIASMIESSNLTVLAFFATFSSVVVYLGYHLWAFRAIFTVYIVGRVVLHAISFLLGRLFIISSVGIVNTLLSALRNFIYFTMLAVVSFASYTTLCAWTGIFEPPIPVPHSLHPYYAEMRVLYKDFVGREDAAYIAEQIDTTFNVIMSCWVAAVATVVFFRWWNRKNVRIWSQILSTSFTNESSFIRTLLFPAYCASRLGTYVFPQSSMYKAVVLDTWNFMVFRMYEVTVAILLPVFILISVLNTRRWWSQFLAVVANVLFWWNAYKRWSGTVAKVKRIVIDHFRSGAKPRISGPLTPVTPRVGAKYPHEPPVESFSFMTTRKKNATASSVLRVPLGDGMEWVCDSHTVSATVCSSNGSAAGLAFEIECKDLSNFEIGWCTLDNIVALRPCGGIFFYNGARVSPDVGKKATELHPLCRGDVVRCALFVDGSKHETSTSYTILRNGEVVYSFTAKVPHVTYLPYVCGRQGLYDVHTAEVKNAGESESTSDLQAALHHPRLRVLMLTDFRRIFSTLPVFRLSISTSVLLIYLVMNFYFFSHLFVSSALEIKDTALWPAVFGLATFIGNIRYRTETEDDFNHRELVAKVKVAIRKLGYTRSEDDDADRDDAN